MEEVFWPKIAKNWGLKNKSEIRSLKIGKIIGENQKNGFGGESEVEKSKRLGVKKGKNLTRNRKKGHLEIGKFGPLQEFGLAD